MKNRHFRPVKFTPCEKPIYYDWIYDISALRDARKADISDLQE